MDKFDQSDKKISIDKAEFLNMYPLPAKFKDHDDKAWELKQIVSKIYDDNEKYKKVTDLLKNLEEKYTGKNKLNINECYLFHMVIGGSREITTFFDFEGEDSIEKILRDIHSS